MDIGRRLQPQTPAVTAFATLLFVATFGIRLIVSDPDQPIMFLLVIPIGIIAAEHGLRGGFLAAAAATGMVIAWELIQQPQVSPFSHIVRLTVFLVSGLGIGALTSARRSSAAEADRWFDQSADLNCVADLSGNFVRVNRAFVRTLGYQLRDLLQTPYVAHVHPDDRQATNEIAAELASRRRDLVGFENRYMTAHGDYRWLRWTATADHERGLIYATARDVSETKELESELRIFAETDALTGLSNRRHFEVEARRQLEFLARYGSYACLIVFDIDGFKTINDVLGHQTGDEAIKKVGTAIKERIRATDAAGRLGGDEFAILFPEAGPHQAELLAEALVDAIASQRVSVTRLLSASIGVAIWKAGDPPDLGALLADADAAMYEAKRAGGNGYRIAQSSSPLGSG